MRGKLALAGLSDAPLDEVCDAVWCLLADGVPDTLIKLRNKLDMASWRIVPPDPDSWGATPRQRAQQDAVLARLAPR